MGNSKRSTLRLSELTEKFTKIGKEANAKGIAFSQVKDILLNTDNSKLSSGTDGNFNVLSKSNCRQWKLWTFKSLTWRFYSGAIVIAIFAVSIGLFVHQYDVRSFQDAKDAIHLEKCILDNNAFMMEIARPIFSCEVCRHLTEVPIEINISKEDFLTKYAYTSVPVLIKEATRNWTAMTTFSFHYFKDVYSKTQGALKSVEDDCQFFPYKTSFTSLGDVLNMSDARANFEPGEETWYIGWSNCHPKVMNKLRRHYQKPYFLPDTESSDLDWIFMGGSGLGAQIHLDYVQRPSWQAQISGKKTWTLIPAPECEHICNSLNITVHKGDIFVIDTNKWYHATFIHPGEISITIGSEYD